MSKKIQTGKASKIADAHTVKGLLSEDLSPQIRDRSLWPKCFKNIIDIALTELEGSSIPTDKARELIEALLISLSFQCGGRGMYLPQANKLRTRIRNYWMYLDTKELSVNEVASKYEVSINSVYSAIKEQKEWV